MRLVIAQCTVDYVGRLTAHLPSARRLLLIKADGSVSVHADDRAYKPLNWMSPPCSVAEHTDGPLPVWVVENKAGEQLRITIEDVEHDSVHELGVDPGLVKDGVEAHLQVLLAEHVELLGVGYTLVRREYMTAIGPVDLLCRDVRANPELKRDPLVRERVGTLAADIEVGRQLMLHCAELAESGTTPPEMGAISKVFSGELMERFGEAALDLLGPRAALSQGAPGALRHGRYEQNLRHSLMWVISIGTNEIQRSLIAQRGLGLPR